MEGRGSSPRERTAVASPAALTMSRMPALRSGWRGAITVSRPGNRGFSRRWAATIAASSPAWVEAAATTVRPAVADFNAASFSASAGGAGTSSLRLPVVEMRGAPRPE